MRGNVDAALHHHQFSYVSESSSATLSLSLMLAQLNSGDHGQYHLTLLGIVSPVYESTFRMNSLF